MQGHLMAPLKNIRLNIALSRALVGLNIILQEQLEIYSPKKRGYIRIYLKYLDSLLGNLFIFLQDMVFCYIKPICYLAVLSPPLHLYV